VRAKERVLQARGAAVQWAAQRSESKARDARQLAERRTRGSSVRMI
jgi:hypothetical protein